MSYKKLLEKHLGQFVESLGVQQKIVVNYSDYEDNQYQTPLGLTLKKQIPNFDPAKIKNFLEENYASVYQKIEVTGPGFISIKFNLTPQDNVIKEPKKVLVDYCGVNVAKQMHIGHIRSMFIGDFVVRLHEYMGDEVVIQNHIGDWGNQFGFLINYIQKNKLEHSLDNKSLTQYYKDAFALNESSDQFAKESAEVAFKLQNKLDSDIVNLWSEMVNISMTQADKTFKELNLKVDLSHTQGESFYAPFCQEVLDTLLTKNIATKNDDGSIVVFFEEKSPLVLQKSNGNFLYALYDLAAIKWRNDHIQPDKMVYVVDKRQALHFEQVFEIALKANFVSDNVQLQHLGFGTILGKDKKPLKTKQGQSLYLDDLFEQGKNILMEDSHFDNMPEAMKTEILNKSIVGGMKYYDLKFNKLQDYIFDWEHVLNFTGNSAPYIQNAVVRIDSIFYKKNLNLHDCMPLDWTYQWNNLEKDIIFNCQKTNEILNYAEDYYTSQAITEHTIKICQLFHKYYESEKIIGHDNEQYKLQLIKWVNDNLQKLCETLGIETYDCQLRMEEKLIQSTQSVVKKPNI